MSKKQHNKQKRMTTRESLQNIQATLQTVSNTQRNMQMSVQTMEKTIHTMQKSIETLDTDQKIMEKTMADYATDTERRFNSIEASMVTKDYLDNKLADMKGEMIETFRKEDTKIYTLTHILHQNKTITPAEFIAVKQLQPFPRK